MIPARSNTDDLITEPMNPFDSFAADYDAWFEGEGRLVFNIEVQAIRELLPHLPRPWLEIGVGSGRFAEIMGIEYGLDSSIRLLEIAKARMINVFLARGERAPFTSESFGTIFLITTLCFLESPLDILREAVRILRSDGRILIGMIPSLSSWGQLYQAKKEVVHPVYKYATFYTYEEVCILLEQAGFTIDRTTSTLFQAPNEVEQLESPGEGYCSDAGFVAVMAGKTGET